MQKQHTMIQSTRIPVRTRISLQSSALLFPIILMRLFPMFSSPIKSPTLFLILSIEFICMFSDASISPTITIEDWTDLLLLIKASFSEHSSYLPPPPPAPTISLNFSSSVTLSSTLLYTILAFSLVPLKYSTKFSHRIYCWLTLALSGAQLRAILMWESVLVLRWYSMLISLKYWVALALISRICLSERSELESWWEERRREEKSESQLSLHLETPISSDSIFIRHVIISYTPHKYITLHGIFIDNNKECQYLLLPMMGSLTLPQLLYPMVYVWLEMGGRDCRYLLSESKLLEIIAYTSLFLDSLYSVSISTFFMSSSDLILKLVFQNLHLWSQISMVSTLAISCWFQASRILFLLQIQWLITGLSTTTGTSMGTQMGFQMILSKYTGTSTGFLKRYSESSRLRQLFSRTTSESSAQSR